MRDLLTRQNIARVIYALTAVAVIVGIAFTLWSNIHTDTIVHVFGAAHDPTEYSSTLMKVVSEFFYFTIWSNVLIGITSGLLALNPNRDGRIFRVLRLTSLVMIFVTGIVFNTVLLGTFFLPNFFAQWGCNLEHVVVPVLALIGWLVAGPRIAFRKGILFGSLIIPAAWIAFTLILGLFPVAGQVNDYFYAYPFIDVMVIGYGAALFHIAIVMVLYVGIAAAVLGLDKVLPGRRLGNETNTGEAFSELPTDTVEGETRNAKVTVMAGV